MACPLCGRGSFATKYLDAADISSREVFSILQCDFCKVKKTEPLPDNLGRYYDNDIGRSMKADPNSVHRFLKNFLLNAEAARIRKSVFSNNVLDVGCGNGDFSSLLHAKGYRVYAADALPDAPAYIGGKDIPYFVINYDTNSMKDFPGLNDGVVVLRHVLEHIREPGLFVEKMISYGAKYFYVVVPNGDSLKSKILGKYNCFLDPPRHVWHFDVNSLKVFFAKAGLETIDFGYDTIPTFVPSLYRFLRLKNIFPSVNHIFQPKGALAALSLPLDYILPGDVVWFLVRKKSGV